MLNLILFGPPGSGKGTQSQKLLEKYQLEHISTGDLLRAEKANETPLGLEAKKFMDQGLLVPDEVVIGMIKNKIEDRHKEVNGFIFDGFPRTVEQSKALDTLLAEKQASIAKLLALDVPEEELVKRLLLRGETSGRADDKDENTIRLRVQEYHEKTAPVADYYGLQGLLKHVKGVGSIDDIFANLCEAVDCLNRVTEEE